MYKKTIKKFRETKKKKDKKELLNFVKTLDNTGIFRIKMKGIKK